MERRAAALGVLVAIIWGLCFVLIQASLPSPAPLLLAALRALIGGGVLAAWIALTDRRPGFRRRRRGPSGTGSWRSGLPPVSQLAALALANAALGLGAMYLAAGRAEATVASILAGGQPLVLAVAGWSLFGERASVRTVAGLTVAVAGVVLVATMGSGGTSADGVVLSLLATTAPAAGTVLMRRIGPNVNLLVTTSAQFLLGGAILLAASAVLEPWSAVRWSPAMIPGFLVLGVLGTGVAYVIWFSLLSHLSLVRLGTALFLIPVTGVVAALAAGERPVPVELAGILTVLAGIWLVSASDTSTGPATGVGTTDGLSGRRP